MVLKLSGWASEILMGHPSYNLDVITVQVGWFGKPVLWDHC